MARYAEGTTVGSDASRAEIERTLRRYDATSFMYGWDEDRAIVGFQMDARQIRFILPMPNQRDPEFTLTPTGKQRSHSAATLAYEQAVRQRWRALALVIKAKLEAVDSEIVTFDQEFGMHFVLPGGGTVGDQVIPAIAEAYQTGVMKPLLAIGAKR